MEPNPERRSDEERAEWRALYDWLQQDEEAQLVLGELLDEPPRPVYAADFTADSGGRLETCAIIDASTGRVSQPRERLDEQTAIAEAVAEWTPENEALGELVVRGLWESPYDPLIRLRTEDAWAEAAFLAGWTIARIRAEQAERDRPWELDGDKK